ncbi:MAG: hypothetical protein H6985_06720 [Pseudomonadales bacterium]|nr:hypothetical protein [Halioglobus sp.]MCP5129257.1 hypothetical protein [Pseudomonadales bacterium]
MQSDLQEFSNKPDFRLGEVYSEGASRLAVKAVPSATVAMHARFGPGVTTMSKTQRSNKESKKPASLTPKEKKAAKRDKKQAGGHTPFVIKND